MSRNQLNRLDILSKANAGFITVREASEAMGITERHVKRLKKKVREEGASAIVHKNTGKSPSNKISKETKAEILHLRKLPEYASSNFKHFQELLSEYHRIEITYRSLHGILTSEGIKSPNTKRRKKKHKRRDRKPQAGLLLQVDATPFAWFFSDRRRYSIHGAIDDATGQITGLFMCKNECLLGYFEMLRRTISNYGIPKSVYADRHAIFQSTNTKKHEIDPSVPVNDTQFGRCLKELGVTLIPAKSPQAKGRVERLWGTLQKRLPVEFAIRNIKTIEAANVFLERYIYDFNSNFAVEPKDTQNAFAKLNTNDNIDHILCVKEKRVIDSGDVFSYGGKSFKIIESIPRIPTKAKIDVLVGSRFGIMAAYKGEIFDVLPFVPPKRKKTLMTTTERKIVIPPKNHPWNEGDNNYVITINERKFESYEEYKNALWVIERALLGKQR